jgi:putative oxidoreductase
MSKNLSARDAASVVLRLGLGIVFIVHGYDKLSHEWGTAWEKEIGWLQPVVAWAELLGGAAVLLGLVTRLSAGALACVMLGAVYVVGQARGFLGGQMEGSSSFGYLRAGAEFPFAMFVQALAVIILGGGTYSVDSWLRRRRSAGTTTATAPAAQAATAPPHMDAPAAPAETAPR